MSVAAITGADLRLIDLFDDVEDADLGPWLEIAQPLDAEAGQILAEPGRHAPAVMLLLEGRIQTYVREGERLEPLGRQVAPTWIGAISVLTGGPVGVRMEAATRCRLALLPADHFHRLALATPAVHRRVMQQVGPVIARMTGVEQSRERLTSLGTMAAGLAHELNNPAAAARRAAALLAEALDDVVAAVGMFVEGGVERAEAAELVALQREVLERVRGRSALDALDAADAEDALRDHLEDLGVEDAWRLAEPLASAGVDAALVGRVARLAGPATGAALAWIAGSVTAQGLAAELQESTDRMSRLVGAVKSYAYMDRGDVVEVDLHEGLETTLVVLGHKLKATAIAVVRDYDRTLPRVAVHGSELNQVWTNLLDNAIDALGAAGTITVRTAREGPCAVIEVTDDGPGIAPGDLHRVFDSFFTTKDVGQGTGLGLATARRIVVERHGGSMTVESAPGATTFRVWIPLESPAGPAESTTEESP